jgi:hypothetical protein
MPTETKKCASSTADRRVGHANQRRRVRTVESLRTDMVK